MAHKHLNDAEGINTEILQEWLTGRGKQPVNWATLTDVLRDIELSTLASEIKAVKCPAGPVSNYSSSIFTSLLMHHKILCTLVCVCIAP